MSRVKRVYRSHNVEPDYIYNNEVFSSFIQLMMQRGKKSLASRLFYEALDLLKKKSDEAPSDIFIKALSNVQPLVEVRSRRVGGANYQIPVEVRGKRKSMLAMRWILSASRSRNERTFQKKLAAEIWDAFQGAGNSIKKRDEVHRMAEANRAFAHLRW